jgi:hypothetical protein
MFIPLVNHAKMKTIIRCHSLIRLPSILMGFPSILPHTANLMDAL